MKMINHILNQKFLNLLDITFKIHFRRTDYIKYSKEKYDLKPFKKSYFSDGMDYYNEEFGDDVVFLWISDDMDWGKKKFGYRKDIVFTDTGNKTTDEAIGYDLALLAQSDHTIITRGTFGMWAAILCGGEYYGPYGPIVPVHILDERQTKGKKKKKKRKH